MIEKKSFEEIPLVYFSRILSGFFDWSILKKIEVLHRENEEEKFSFWKKIIYSHHYVHILTHLVKLNSNISIPIRENIFSPCKSRYQNMPLPQTCQIWGKNLRRLHLFGNGHELFDALKDQSWVAWWRQWYFWFQHYLRTWHICYFTHVQQNSKNSSFFFFIFAMINFDFFKSGSIKNTATNA